MHFICCLNDKLKKIKTKTSIWLHQNMHKQNRHIINFLKFILLLFFIGHYSNTTLFYHTHEIDGRIYCHSHFFGFNINDKGIPTSTHTHTANQFNLIQLYNQINLTADLDIPELPEPAINYVLVKLDYQITKTQLPKQALLRLRAPPAC